MSKGKLTPEGEIIAASPVSFGCLLHPEQTAAAAQFTTAPKLGGPYSRRLP